MIQTAQLESSGSPEACNSSAVALNVKPHLEVVQYRRVLLEKVQKPQNLEEAIN